VSKPIPPETADEVYTILVQEVGACDYAHVRDDFIRHQGEGCREYRFHGRLGFGGKFRNDLSGWRVDCYPEDETGERIMAMTRANRRLKWLKERARIFEQ
jgi:hypothetical protein